MSNDQKEDSVGDEKVIDLRELLVPLWKGRWITISSTVAGVLLAIGLALYLPNMYRAEALLAPNIDDNGANLSALGSQVGGLASLAGIDLRQGGVDNTDLGLEILQSRKFIGDFVERHDILAELLAARTWDRTSDVLVFDNDLYDAEGQEWVRDVSPPRTVIPSKQEAFNEFSAILNVRRDGQTGFVHISIEHLSPNIAKQWVDWIVEDLNAYVMNQDVAEAERAISFLQEQIGSTSMTGLHEVFYRLIEEQTKTVMLANVTPEYVFRTIDPAIAPETSSSPSRILVVLFGAFLGFSIGILLVLFLYLRQRLT